MRRISNEDGLNAGFRNVGRYTLALIPAALGGAACLWIAAAVGWLDLTREINITQRTMNSVGISAMPKAPIQIVTNDGACLKVDSSFMDGNVLVFYATNKCSIWIDYPTYSYHVKAHDGTTIDSQRYRLNGDTRIGPDERREQRVHSVSNDPRSEAVELWMLN